MSKTLVVKLLCLAIAAGSFERGTAQAAPDPATSAPAVHVRYSDLDLSTASGAEALYRRIVIAARVVCPQLNAGPSAGHAASRACQAQAIERAVRELHNPPLAALHEEEKPRLSQALSAALLHIARARRRSFFRGIRG